MAESLKRKYERRVFFPFGEQERFLSRARKKLNLSWTLFAKKIKVHKRTLNDWKREAYSMPLDRVYKISKTAKIKVPKNIKIKEPFWYVYKGSKIGGKFGAIACFKKYGSYGGDPEYRKKKWREWWEREGKYKSNVISAPKSIKKPVFSEKLAEFVGIILGDGSIGKNQVSITLHSKDDKKYGEFVVSLMKNLFNAHVGIHHRKDFNATNYNISRVELIRFCTEKLGLKQGNKVKQQVDIPDWIKNNNKYSIACVKGLIDTDGCIFNHSYKVNNKEYSYKKLSFTNHSYPLRKSVFNILKYNGLNPRFVKTKEDIRLDSIIDMQKYFKIFGSHNPKHLKKIKN
ncbi:hypothetical protein AMJ47_01750 [Parcubacteria bacterium DG_72]|nr:MAG: hypothetical protein AMJ47_01750 [Parcubacteria bacterium DG_72]